jgi:glycosyltransferase involved in cell wall biosynthesis
MPRANDDDWANPLPGDHRLRIGVTTMASDSRPLRIALVAPPLLPVPPPAYGGTERVVDALASSLHQLGHEVTLFASGDSVTPARLVPTVDRACWTGGRWTEEAAFARTNAIVTERADRFDVIHSHLESWGFALARSSPTPVVSTLHGRLDHPRTKAFLVRDPDVPVVAISHSQRATNAGLNWLGVVYNGQDVASVPFGPVADDYLLFVGRSTREKGIDAAIRAATLAGERLVIAAKVREPIEREVFETDVRPALEPGRIDFVGEVSGAVRDRLFARAKATLMLDDWPEPFGLVAIESLAAGTPVIATPCGALPEIVHHGLDGAIVRDAAAAAAAVREVAALDRWQVRSRVLRRFSALRMANGYLDVYRRSIEEARGAGSSVDPVGATA